MSPNMRAALAVIALAMLCAWGVSRAAPVAYTTKGYIVLTCGGVEVSRHSQDSEMDESALNYAVTHGGKASCDVTYPSKMIVFDIPLQAAPPPPALTAPTLTAAMAPNKADPTRTDIALSWTAVTGVTGYDVERCSGANCTNFLSIGTATADSQPGQSNTNLPAGTTLKYRVRGFDASAKGPYSNVVTVTTPAPAPPPPPATGNASLQWEAPATNSDGSALVDLAGYRIVYGTDPAQLGQQVEVANAALTSFVVDHLSAGTWFFAVRAYNSSGAESANSNVASKLIQ